MLNVVVTMAGRGSRFRKQGYTIPKYEILARGRTLFYWSLFSLCNLLSSGANLICVCLREDKAIDFIRREIYTLGIQQPHIIQLDGVTDGQATTAFQALKVCYMGDPLLIYNIDTFINPKSLTLTDFVPNCDGWVPYFDAKGTHWSFLKCNADRYCTEFAEKKRISSHATLGLYGFKSANLLKEAYESYYGQMSKYCKTERYIAPLYNILIKKGYRIYAHEISAQDVHVLGTPEEVRAFEASDPNLGTQ